MQADGDVEKRFREQPFRKRSSIKSRTGYAKSAWPTRKHVEHVVEVCPTDVTFDANRRLQVICDM